MLVKLEATKNKTVLDYAFQELLKIFTEVVVPRNSVPALVFDIDGTVLQHSPCTIRRTVIPHAMRIFNWATRNNILVYFVTARIDTPENRQLTVSELVHHKFVPFADLYMRHQAIGEIPNSESISKYKSEARKRIATTSTILMNFGDQIGDFVDLLESRKTGVSLISQLLSLDQQKSYFFLLENSPCCVKLKDEFPRTLEDIILYEKSGYKSNRRALEQGFILLAELYAKALGKGRSPAIVFDIDATVIYNHHNDNSHKVSEAYNIYKWALEKKIKVFFVTARPDIPEQREFAKNDLSKSGYLENEYSGLAMWPDAERGSDNEDASTHRARLSQYKHNERCKIAENNALLMSFGDSISDLIPMNADERQRSHTEKFVRSLRDDRAYVLKLRRNMTKYNVKLKTEK
jgi:predicted secreted acid phosphatase